MLHSYLFSSTWWGFHPPLCCCVTDHVAGTEGRQDVLPPSRTVSSVQFSHSVMSNFLQPHGHNPGQSLPAKHCCVVLLAQSCLTLRPHGLKPARLLRPWNSPGENTGVGCHSLFQGIFPTQGWNPGVLHCRRILYVFLSHRGRYVCHLETDVHKEDAVCVEQRSPQDQDWVDLETSYPRWLILQCYCFLPSSLLSELDGILLILPDLTQIFPRKQNHFPLPPSPFRIT